MFLKSIIKRFWGSLAYFSHKFKINLPSSFEIKIWLNVKSGNIKCNMPGGSIKCNMPEKRNSTLYTILKLKWILSKRRKIFWKENKNWEKEYLKECTWDIMKKSCIKSNFLTIFYFRIIFKSTVILSLNKNSCFFATNIKAK